MDHFGYITWSKTEANVNVLSSKKKLKFDYIPDKDM